MHRLYPLFFLSGAAGLVYQVVWSRLFHELFGVTVYAVTTVLATFLAGLALGGVVLGRVVDRRASALRFYGWLEIGIALTVPWGLLAMRLLEPAHLWAANRLEPDAPSLILVRAALAAVVILPPTFLMGGTLPAMTRAVVSRFDRLGRELSLLYALNTLGAVAGSLAAGFFLIRFLGLHATLWTAVVLNALVGVASLVLARSLPGPAAGQPEVADSPAGTAAPARAGTGLLVVMALSGFVTLGLEVIWTRTLVMIIGTTTYSFVTMLSSFLVGIALGSFVARLVVDRMTSRLRAFGWIQVGVAASALATLPLVGSGVAQRWLTGWGQEWVTLVALRFGVSFLIMLVPAFLIGTTFPLAARIRARRLGRVGGELGELYGANTAGNILGATVTGFVLLPALGLQRGVALLAVLSLACAAWAFFTSAATTRERGRLASVPVALGAVVCMPLLLLWSPAPLPVWDEQPDDETLYYREGVVATVKVLRKAYDPDHLWMTVDGIKIGQSLGGVDAKQQALAHLPFLLRPGAPPRRVLSIGLGTAILAGEVTRHPSVESMDALEISPSVIEAAREFDAFNHGALDEPRVRIVADDGVNFLRRTDASYDAIISDAKSRTKHAANGTFFSADYYRLCRERLAGGGLMIQWLPLDVPPGELRTILRTFRQVFPTVHVLVSPPINGFLVGTEEPLVLDTAHGRSLLARPETEGLRRYGLRAPEQLVAWLAADGRSLERWLAAEDTVNTFEHPVLEFYSPREHAVPPPERNDANLLGLLASGLGPEGDGYRVDRDAAAALSAWADAAARLRQAAAAVRAGEGSQAELVQRAAALARGNPFLLHAAAAVLREAVGRAPADGRLHEALGDLVERLGRPGAAAAHYRRAAELRPDDAGIRVRLGLNLKRSGRLDDALASLDDALRLRPDDALALTTAAEILATHPDEGRRDPAGAVSRAERAASLTGGRNPHVLNTLATAYASSGDLDRARRTAVAALEIAEASGNTALAGEIRRRLALFEQGRAF